MRTLVLLLVGLIFFIVISVIIAKRIENWAGMVFLLLGVSAGVFIWGVYVAPVFAYFRFLKDLITGKTRQIHGRAVEVSSHPVYKDNKLYFYEVGIEEDGVERLLLLDDQKEWPKINISESYNFEVHENFITDIEPA